MDNRRAEKEREIEKLEARGFLRVFLPLRKALLFNFLGGIAWGFGAVLGATVLVALALALFNALGGVPLLGDFIGKVREQVEQSNRFDVP